MQFVKSAVSFSENWVSTICGQLFGKGSGPGDSLNGLDGLFLLAKLDQGHSAAEATISALSGLASMYRIVLKKRGLP